MIRTLSAAVLASAMMAGAASAQVYVDGATHVIDGPQISLTGVTVGNDTTLDGINDASFFLSEFDGVYLLGGANINDIDLSGTADLTKVGPNSAFLNSESTYTGFTDISGTGALVLTEAGVLSGTSGISVGDDAALIINNNVSLTHAADIDLNTSGTLILRPDGTFTYVEGDISGDIDSAIVHDGVGVTVLNGDNSGFLGDTFVDAGELVVNGVPPLLGGRMDFGNNLTVAADAAAVLNDTRIAGVAEVDGSLLLDNSAVIGDLNVNVDGTATLIDSFVGEDVVVDAGGRARIFDSVIGDTLVVLNDGFARVVSSDIDESLIVREGGRAVINDTFIGENVRIFSDIANDDRGILVARGLNEVAGNVFNDGVLVLRPDFDPVSNTVDQALLFVGGDYVQGDDAALVLSIRDSRNYAQIAVGDEAFLDGALVVGGARRSLASPGRAYRGDVLTIIDTVNGVNGTFDEVYGLRSNTMLHYDVRYTSDAVQLVVHQDKFASLPNLTHNQRQVATALDAAAKRNQIDDVFNYLNYTHKDNIPGLLNLLSPEALTSVYNIGFATSQIQNVHLERRLEDVRAGAYGFSAAGFAMTNSQGTINLDGAPVANTQDGLTLAGWDGKSIVTKEVVAPVIEQSRWGFFITGFGEWADIETTRNSRGQTFESAGFTLGADYRVSENFVIGINGGYAHTSSEWDNNGRVRVDGGRGGVYGSFFSNGFFVNGAVGGGYNSYRTNRTTIGSNQARGDFDGGEFNALLGLGYDVRVGGLTIGPVASAQYTYIGIGSFEERGSVANLNFRKQHQESLRSTVGLKASYAWDTGSVIIRPEVRAQWKHEYLDSTPSIEARFAGADRLFRVDGPDIGRDSLLLDAGASIEINPAVSVYAYYTGELGRTNYDSHSVNGGFRVSF